MQGTLTSTLSFYIFLLGMYFEEVIASQFGEMTVNGTGLSNISTVTGKRKSPGGTLESLYPMEC